MYILNSLIHVYTCYCNTTDLYVSYLILDDELNITTLHEITKTDQGSENVGRISVIF